MLRLIWIVAELRVCNVFTKVEPAGVFTDFAVLQQGAPVRIWGTAAPSEKVSLASYYLDTL